MPTISNLEKKTISLSSIPATASSSCSTNSNDKSPNFLKIESALRRNNDVRRLCIRSHSTLNAASLSKIQCGGGASRTDLLTLNVENQSDGSVHVSRTDSEKDANPDRISLDRRGLSAVPIIIGENKLRLLSLQHNLINNLEAFKVQKFPNLVFLDIYDNQLDRISCLDGVENLRVLLMGKNRIRKIEGLSNLKKIEVLDLHGNQITQVNGLQNLKELKVLNLAGNQIKLIGVGDLEGLVALEELNLRRNRLRKLLGFGETTQLTKLFLSNNDLQCVEDISSLAKSSNLKEISIDGNPLFLGGGDCVSFLVSYLPNLSKLNSMNITEQVKKAAMAWRRNKETTNAAFMDLTSDVCLNVRREEIISNARTNWELLRSQTKCLTVTKNTTGLGKTLKNLKPDSDIILTSLPKNYNTLKLKSKSQANIPTSITTSTTKVPAIVNNKKVARTNSLDTETTSSSSNTPAEFFRLPPILVPIINKLEQKNELKLSSSLSSIGPNIDSSNSSAGVGECCSSTSCISTEDTEEEFEEQEEPQLPIELGDKKDESNCGSNETNGSPETTTLNNKTAATPTTITTTKPRIKSALNGQCRNATNTKASRATTAAAKSKQRCSSPNLSSKDREQGGDYLIEICGRFLNVYGQCALRFIDKPWNHSKANDVNSVKFNYVNFNSIAPILNKLKLRFPNVEHFFFKETNIQSLGQLNALAEVQGLTSLYIEPEGNPIVGKKWESYAIYRLNHWGLKFINERPITDHDIELANEEYQSLSDLVLWSLPDVLLKPLLTRLRLVTTTTADHNRQEQNVKNWLLSADPALKNVVSKEALQWRKAGQMDQEVAKKAKILISSLLDEMCNTVKKLRLLEKEWPIILQEFVRNTLVDYTQLDLYMKQKMQQISKL